MSNGPRQVAFVGLGRLGMPMCARLRAAGFDVSACDLRGELRGEAERIGARWAPSITAALASADLLITVLPGPSEVLAAADEVASALTPESSWIEMSSATPAVARELADRCGPRAIDAPVGGGPDAARAGQLLVFFGGSAAELERWQGVLAAIATRAIPIGARGGGYATKLLVNALWFTYAVATAEALALASRVGLDLEVTVSALRESAASSGFLGPGAQALLDGDQMATFGLGRCCEELDAVRALGAELGVRLDVIGAVASLYDDALQHFGDVDGELLGARLVGERSGVDLRR